MIGTKIRKARVAHYLSQENLVEALGITQASLSRIESDLQIPGLSLLHQISIQLKLDFNELTRDLVNTRKRSKLN